MTKGGYVATQLPSRFIVEMSQRRHRFYHYLWHRVRKSWLRLTEAERRAVREINPQWVPPRPALDAAGRPMRENDSGEDFLFMYRQMITNANDLLARTADPAYPRVEGWRRVPPPGDAVYQVPPFPDSELEEVKSAETFEFYIRPWELRYTDPVYLRGVTLGQLGSDIEFTIHNDLLMRWAAPSPVGYRPSKAAEPDIGEQWDAPAYNYLGDTYSSCVNPIFWKIHGWVDDRIEDWRRARGLTGEIEWTGTWVGSPGEGRVRPDQGQRTASEGATAAAGTLEEWCLIHRIISASAARECDGFFRPVVRRRMPY